MDSIKKLITSVLVSSKSELTIEKLNFEYKELMGDDIPYKNLGFNSLEEFLRKISDIVQIRNSGPSATLRPVTSKKSSHMRELVEKQRGALSKNKNGLKLYRNASSKIHWKRAHAGGNNKVKSFRVHEVKKQHAKGYNFEEKIVDLQNLKDELEIQNAALVDQNKILEKKNIDIQAQNADLRKQNSDFQEDYARLEEMMGFYTELGDRYLGLLTQNLELQRKNDEIEEEKSNVASKNKELKQHNKGLKSHNEELELRAKEMDEENMKLVSRNLELEAHSADLENRNRELSQQTDEFAAGDSKAVVFEVKLLKELLGEMSNKNAVLKQNNLFLIEKIRELELEAKISKLHLNNEEENLLKDNEWNPSQSSSYESSIGNCNRSSEGDIADRDSSQVVAGKYGIAAEGNDIREPERKVWLYLHSVKKSVSVEKIKNYIHRKSSRSIQEIEVKEIPGYPECRYNKFVVRIPHSEKNIISKGKFWPSGVGVKDFDFNKNKRFVEKHGHFFSRN